MWNVKCLLLPLNPIPGSLQWDGVLFSLQITQEKRLQDRAGHIKDYPFTAKAVLCQCSSQLLTSPGTAKHAISIWCLPWVETLSSYSFLHIQVKRHLLYLYSNALAPPCWACWNSPVLYMWHLTAQKNPKPHKPNNICTETPWGIAVLQVSMRKDLVLPSAQGFIQALVCYVAVEGWSWAMAAEGKNSILLYNCCSSWKVLCNID